MVREHSHLEGIIIRRKQIYRLVEESLLRAIAGCWRALSICPCETYFPKCLIMWSRRSSRMRVSTSSLRTREIQYISSSNGAIIYLLPRPNNLYERGHRRYRYWRLRDKNRHERWWRLGRCIHRRLVSTNSIATKRSSTNTSWRFWSRCSMQMKCTHPS